VLSVRLRVLCVSVLKTNLRRSHKLGGRSPNRRRFLGAGLTGLTAAYVLRRKDVPVQVFEADHVLGGASRTVRYEGFRFESSAGTGFYTKNQRVLDLVHELIGDELVTVERVSRIYLDGKFVDYPLSFFSALAGLGPFRSLAVAGSYAAQKSAASPRRPKSAPSEQWVVNRFGPPLYEIYFKPYSEKVWGIPCSELGADFAAQRIKGMSFRAALRSMLLPQKNAPATLRQPVHLPAPGLRPHPRADGGVAPGRSAAPGFAGWCASSMTAGE